MKKDSFFICMAIGLGLFATSCGNNGDLPKEENYQNTTETAPEVTDNETGYGNITDSTATNSGGQSGGSAMDTTSGTTGAGTSATTGGTTSGPSSSGTTDGK